MSLCLNGVAWGLRIHQSIMKIYSIPLLVFALLVSETAIYAKEVSYQLTISEKIIQPTGKKVKAIAVNDSIPAPTLRFKVGDTAVIKVSNSLKNQQASIHWHGILLPNEEDGVPYLTTPPIEVGKDRVFRFPLTHPGTYWYHSHTGLQEQQGVYGSIVVEPIKKSNDADREYVIVLSDWTNENPKSVMKTLMRGSEYYAVKKGSAQSIWGAYKKGQLKSYFRRERSRMPSMDMSDVYYDQFWVNGKPKIQLDAAPGERIKLRFINAGASTYFYINSATGKMTVVAADGPKVIPTKISTLLMGMAETYDVVVTMPKHGAYEVRATAQDNSGHASIILGKGAVNLAKSPPKANLYTMDEMVEGAMMSMGIHEDSSMAQLARPQAPYHKLRSPNKTNYKATLPRREIELRLTGDMKRYIWSFDNKTLKEQTSIKVKKGEVVRFKLVNDTMMHHPLHLHGHFFRIINQHGAYSPLKHTVDVPPMGQRTIEFLANEEKDWFFHCHLLYHMDAGMARVVSYKEQGEGHEPSIDPKLLNPIFFMGEGSIQNHMTMGTLMVMRGREDLYASWHYGLGDHKEYEIDLAWKHYFNANISSIAGYRLTNERGSINRLFTGAEYRLPYLAYITATLDSEGAARLELEKELQITGRLTLTPTVEYDTNSEWDWNISADYLLTRDLSLTAGYDSSHGIGGGVKLRF